MTAPSPWAAGTDDDRAAAIAGLVAEGHDVAWLDGGAAARGVVGIGADRWIEGDDVGVLAAVERQWRREPDAVWIGCITYDFAADLVLGRRPRSRAMPGIGLGRYRHGLELGTDGSVRVFGAPPGPPAGLRPAPQWPLGALEPVWTPAEYRARVVAARRHIIAGDTYQVNLAQRFAAPWLRPCRADELPRRTAGLYLRLRAKAPAERGALLRTAAGFVLSNSPETLVDVDHVGGELVARARPIKGTRPRASTAAGDRAAQQELRSSAKDLAEHVMIVDLVRNDLGRLAKTGTVHAPARPEDLALPTVHHLVTEIRASLRPDVGLAELFAALVPGGSVTGAPKRRTIEIIEALEDHPRGIYCGAIVLLERGGLRMSIPIRTAVASVEGLALHAGGGIVVDSDPEGERLESLAKTRAFEP